MPSTTYTRTKSLISWCLWYVLLCHPSLVYAESPKPEDQPISIQPPPTRRKKPKQRPIKIRTIQVRPKKRLPTPEQKDPTGFATVIDVSQKTRRVRSLSGVLQEQAGVSVRSAGGLGASSVVSIRGSASSQVLVLLDGVPLNGGGNGSINLAELPLGALRSVTLYRGFAPVHLGGAMGGVLELNTLLPRGYSRLQLSSAIGSFGTVKLDATGATRVGKWSFLGFANLLREEGDFPYYDDRGTPLYTGDDIDAARRQNNHSTSTSSLLRASYRLARRSYLRITHLLNLRDQGVPGIGNFRSREAHYTSLQQLLQVSLNGTQWPQPGLNWESQLYVRHRWEAYQDLLGELGVGRQQTDNHGFVFGGSGRVMWLLMSFWQLSVSARIRREGFWPKDQLNKQEDGSERSRWSLLPGVENTFSFFDDRLVFLAGGRLEWYFNAFGPQQAQASAPVQFFPTGRVGAKVKPWRWLRLQSNVGHYSRLPTFFELFGDRGATKGNPSLTPESGWMWDVGAIVSLEAKGALTKLSLGYAFFWVEATDLIRLIQNSQRTSVALNFEAARIQGHEINLRTIFFKCFRLDADLTFTDAINLGQDSFEQGKQLPGRPQWEVSLRGELFVPWGRLFYTYTGLGGNFLDRANRRELGTRHLHTLGAALRPALLLRHFGLPKRHWTGLEITLELRNLTDERIVTQPLNPPLPNVKEVTAAISDFSGYPLPGRAVYLLVRWRI